MTEDQFKEISSIFRETLQKVDTIKSSVVHKDNYYIVSKINDLVKNINELSNPLAELSPWLLDENGKVREEHTLEENQSRLNSVLICYLLNAQNQQMSMITEWVDEIEEKFAEVEKLDKETSLLFDEMVLTYNRIVARLPELEEFLRKQ